VLPAAQRRERTLLDRVSVVGLASKESSDRDTHFAHAITDIPRGHVNLLHDIFLHGLKTLLAGRQRLLVFALHTSCDITADNVRPP